MFKATLKAPWCQLQGKNVQTVLDALNPIIRGWARYYRGVVSKEFFGRLDDWMFNRAFLWARRIHPRKSWTWRRTIPGATQAFLVEPLDFRRQDNRTLPPVVRVDTDRPARHGQRVRLTGRPDLADYREQRRQRKVTDLSGRWQQLARRQHGVCPNCQLTLFNDEELHVRTPRRHNTETPSRLVQRICNHPETPGLPGSDAAGLSRVPGNWHARF